MRAALVGRFAVGHRADDGDLVGHRGGFFHELTELNTGDFRIDRTKGPAVLRGRERFGIERLLMRQSAGQEDVDHPLGDPFFGFVEFLRRARLLLQESRQGQAETAEQTDIEKVPP